ncbi:MAG: polysaccharide deacetylase family protein, partial [Clostridia bacterium]|nr:polysaccharide deacetylase family protein [Clostridia bacterium]
MKRKASRVIALLLIFSTIFAALVSCTRYEAIEVKGKPGKDGNGIVSITKTATVGLVDTYTITFSDASTSTFTVTNGADGIQGIQGPAGIKGEDGHTPVITIQNGYWYIDGVNTQQSATGLPSNYLSTELNSEELWETGGITVSGSEYKSSKTLRTKEFLAKGVSLIYAQGDYTFTAHIYDESGNCLGAWDGKEISNASTKKLYYLNTEGLQGYKIRLMLYRYDATSVSLEECENIHFLSEEKAKSFYPTPTLTFIDDDGSLDALMNWESICDQIGIKITSALVTGVMGDGEKNPAKASWEDVMRLQNKGFEFVSHTHHHINLTKSSEERIIQEFEDSIAALREHGCESRYLVYPYNAINTDLMPLVQKYFSAGIGLGMESDNVLPIYTYHIRRYSINDTSISVEKEYNGEIVSVHSFKSLDTLKDYIDDAIINGGWVIIMTHLRNDGIFYFDEEIRDNIIELCKYATERGVRIKTFGEAFEEYKNTM